jgi:NTE family protein
MPSDTLPNGPGSRSRRHGIAACAALLAGCALDVERDHRGDDAPAAVPLSGPVRTAWVFSSGGPRGFVHVGVLKALDELALEPDLIVGASVGALVGTMRAAGLPAAAIESLALELSPTALARIAMQGDAWLSGAPLAGLVRRHAPVQRLDRMPIAMAVVACRQSDSRVTAFTAGDAAVAVQASAAIEGRFAPVRIRGEPYVDADRHMPMPVRIARRLGAQRVLAIDASAHEDRAPPGAASFRADDLRKRALIEADAALADRVLHPDFGYWVGLTREFRERAIEAGYRETLAQAPALRALHAG